MLTPNETKKAHEFYVEAKGCTCKLTPDAFGRLNQIDHSCPYCQECLETSRKLNEYKAMFAR